VTQPPPLRVAAYLIGVAGLAFCITLLWFGMRAVLDIGGFCASGGPYVIADQCPEAVIATTPLSILGGLVAVGLMLWGAAGLGSGWLGLVFLAWPALFISLGWNFLQYGLFPPDGGLIWSWVICGVLFVAMGAVPLWVAISVWREGSGAGERAYAAGRVVVRPRPLMTEPAVQPPAPDPDTPEGPLVERLEPLAALRRRGDITNDEYESAKAATLAEAARESAP
jgi:hypothetical protein